MGKTKKGGRHAKIIKKAKQAKRRRKMKEASLRGETAEFSPEPEHARRMGVCSRLTVGISRVAGGAWRLTYSAGATVIWATVIAPTQAVGRGTMALARGVGTVAKHTAFATVPGLAYWAYARQDARIKDVEGRLRGVQSLTDRLRNRVEELEAVIAQGGVVSMVAAPTGAAATSAKSFPVAAAVPPPPPPPMPTARAGGPPAPPPPPPPMPPSNAAARKYRPSGGAKKSPKKQVAAAPAFDINQIKNVKLKKADRRGIQKAKKGASKSMGQYGISLADLTQIKLKSSKRRRTASVPSPIPEEPEFGRVSLRRSNIKRSPGGTPLRVEPKKTPYVTESDKELMMAILSSPAGTAKVLHSVLGNEENGGAAEAEEDGRGKKHSTSPVTTAFVRSALRRKFLGANRQSVSPTSRFSYSLSPAASMR